MCGVIGITSARPVVAELYEGLIQLQHRGQDSAGITTYRAGFHTSKGVGYVREAFSEEALSALDGTVGIGHTRYTTAGLSNNAAGAQPFIINEPNGIALVHNGNLTNYQTLKHELAQNHVRFSSDSDTEVLLNVLADELRAVQARAEFFEILAEAVERLFARARGAYSVIGIVSGEGMFAFRDPHGIRPLVIGTRGDDVVISSEDTVNTPLGFSYLGDVMPGELVFIDLSRKMTRRRLVRKPFTPCVFEYVYLARPDAFINQVSVYRARLRMGENLAKRWKETYPRVVPDVVVPIPFSSNPVALSFAGKIGVRYSEGIYKNSFVGRTFMMPRLSERKKSVHRKLSPQKIELAGKDVLLLDDSIVRGNVSREAVSMVRAAGAKKVYFASACPPLRYPDFYGIDIPTRNELIAAYKTEKEIREYIGADILLYQTIPDLVEAVTRKGDHGIDRLSMPYLDGVYITEDVDEESMARVGSTRKKERAQG